MSEIKYEKKYWIAAAIIIGAGTLMVVFSTPKIPASLVLHVPFSPQAPTDNWSRNEDCEETSVSMANAYLDGQTEDRMPVSDAQDAIAKLKSWEQINFQHNADTGADETTAMAEGAFKITVKQIKDFTELDLKRELVKKHVILLPINARLLGSPKYKDNGPFYHMVVVRGFDERGFIVNDPGTDSGDGNVYTFATLITASADWDNVARAMIPTRKIALILSK